MCNLIEAMVVTPSDITDSNLPAQDHATWLVGTTYAKDNRVCALSSWQVGPDVVEGMKVYRSMIDGNTGNNPVGDDGTKWLDEGPTSRMLPFDGTIGSQASNTGTVECTILTDRTCDALGLFGMVGTSARVQVQNSSLVTIYDQTFSLVDRVERNSWWKVFFATREYRDTLVIEGLPFGSGRYLKVTVDAGAGVAKLGACAAGSKLYFGPTRPGTDARIEDFSDLNEDQYGNIAPVLRGQIRWVTFKFVYQTKNRERLLRWVARNSQRLVVAYQAVGAEQYGTLVYGIINDARLPGESVSSEGTLEMRGSV